MRLAYVFDPLLPHRDADAEQAMQTIAALTDAGAYVELFLPRRMMTPGVTPAEIGAYYKVRGDLPVSHLRSLYPSHRSVEKLAHAVRAAACRRLRQFDVVYSRNASAMLGALAWGHPVVYETYRPWHVQYAAVGPLLRAAMARPNFVGGVLHSGFARDRYIELGVDADRLAVVHNGFDPARFATPMSRGDARRALGLPDDMPIALYAGRVTMGKGLGVVLDMAERMPGVRFVLVGSQGPGEVEARAASLPNVTLGPWASADQLPAWLWAADVLMLPPSRVGLDQRGDTVLPMKLFLYLAAERPLFAPRAPDTAEILRDGDNAVLVEPEDVERACAALGALLVDPDRADRLARSAAVCARSFTWRARADKILAFLDRRLARAARRLA